MRVLIDKNNLLTIENPNIPKTKKYYYNLGGYDFCDFDKWIIVLHKKERKIINLKNLGDNMSVCYVAQRASIQTAFDIEGFIKGLCLFESFDENTGKKYYFIPKFAEKEIEAMNKKLEILGIQATIEKTEKWCLIKGDIQAKEHRGKYTSFLFALTLLYGKMTIKNHELIGIKIHIPLFGQYIKYEEALDTMQQQLADEGIFIKTSKQKSNNGSIYQITSSDYEFLEIFAKFYQPIEKWIKISTLSELERIRIELVEFVKNSKEIPSEWKIEVLKKIESGMIKVLVK